MCVLVFFRLWFSSFGPAVSDPFRPAEPNDKVALGGVKRQVSVKMIVYHSSLCSTRSRMMWPETPQSPRATRAPLTAYLGWGGHQAAAAQRRDATAPVEYSVEQLMAMRVPELRRWAKQCGVSGYSKLRKHELASLLVGARSPETRRPGSSQLP